MEYVNNPINFVIIYNYARMLYKTFVASLDKKIHKTKTTANNLLLPPCSTTSTATTTATASATSSTSSSSLSSSYSPSHSPLPPLPQFLLGVSP
jgi:hypothetical protein